MRVDGTQHSWRGFLNSIEAWQKYLFKLQLWTFFPKTSSTFSMWCFSMPMISASSHPFCADGRRQRIIIFNLVFSVSFHSTSFPPPLLLLPKYCQLDAETATFCHVFLAAQKQFHERIVTALQVQVPNWNPRQEKQIVDLGILSQEARRWARSHQGQLAL